MNDTTIASLPKFYDMMLPLLHVAADGTEVRDQDAEQHLAKTFNLTEQQILKLKPSGNERLFLNRMRWAKTALMMAKLLARTKRAHFRITERGKQVLLQKPKRLTEKFLRKFQEYREKRGLDIRIEKVWAMPNKWTFIIDEIAQLIDEERIGYTVDPFSGQSEIADVRNDIDPNSKAHYHMDALDFLRLLESESADTVIEDGIYSPTQNVRCYKHLGLQKTHKFDGKYFSQIKKEIARIVKIGGKAICCGWDGNGIGKKYGFRMERLLIVTHGSRHNATLVTVERKIRRAEFEK